MYTVCNHVSCLWWSKSKQVKTWKLIVHSCEKNELLTLWFTSIYDWNDCLDSVALIRRKNSYVSIVGSDLWIRSFALHWFEATIESRSNKVDLLNTLHASVFGSWESSRWVRRNMRWFNIYLLDCLSFLLSHNTGDYYSLNFWNPEYCYL